MRTAGLLWYTVALAAFAQVKNERPVLTFETVAEVQGIRTSGASVRRVAQDATDGRYALEVQFEAGDQASVTIPVGAGDWRGFGSLGLDTTSVSSDPVMFSVEVQDETGAKTTGRTWWQVMPGEHTATMSVRGEVAELSSGSVRYLRPAVRRGGGSECAHDRRATP
jgi:hypothetical protein